MHGLHLLGARAITAKHFCLLHFYWSIIPCVSLALVDPVKPSYGERNWEWLITLLWDSTYKRGWVCHVGGGACPHHYLPASRLFIGINEVSQLCDLLLVCTVGSRLSHLHLVHFSLTHIVWFLFPWYWYISCTWTWVVLCRLCHSYLAGAEA